MDTQDIQDEDSKLGSFGIHSCQDCSLALLSITVYAVLCKVIAGGEKGSAHTHSS